MSRESRIIVVLLVMAGLAVGGLSVIARSYKRALGPQAAQAAQGAQASARAIELVDGFLAARAAGQAAMGTNAGASPSPELVAAYRSARGSVLAAHGMSVVDYVAVRTACHDFLGGMPPRDPALAAALDQRKGALATDDFRATEALDLSIN